MGEPAGVFIFSFMLGLGVVCDVVVEFIDDGGGNSIGVCFGWISTLDGEDGEST